MLGQDIPNISSRGQAVNGNLKMFVQTLLLGDGVETKKLSALAWKAKRVIMKTITFIESVK